MILRTVTVAGTLTLCSALLAAPLAPAASWQPGADNAAAAANGDALVVYSAGIDAMLADPRDAGLLRALHMLDERVAELPRELDEDDMPGPALQLALQLLMSPMSLRGGLLEMNGGEPQGPPFYAQLSFYGSPEHTADLAGRVAAMLVEAGAPAPQQAPTMPGMQTIDADGVPLYLGTMKGASDNAFVVALNQASSPDLALDATGLPSGVKPSFAFTLDAPKLQPLADMMMPMAGDQADMLRGQLEMSGLYGPNAARITMVSGHGKDRCHAVLRYTHFRQLMEANGMMTDGMLSSADLKRIPADATCASITRMNIQGLVAMIKQRAIQAMQAQGEDAGDPFQMVQDAIGVHPQRDIIDHLGQTMGAYMSDSTGGGGLTSLVGFIEVKNPDGLNQTIARLRGMANQIGQQQARGYVRIAEREANGQKFMTVLFPGLPVPLEICWGMADGYLYAAGSPNALLAAMHQGQSGGKNLTDNHHFREMGGSDLKDAMQIRFLDTPRLAGLGYGVVSMGMSALANAVRSPTDLKRDPGFIMPSYHELIHDAKAMVSVSRVQGDDMVMTAQGDRSVLVNASGLIGMAGGAGGIATLSAMVAGMARPMAMHAQRQAHDTRSMVTLRSVGMAYHTFAADSTDAFPDARETVIRYIDGQPLNSPHGPCAVGGEDYWLNLAGKRVSAIERPDTYVIAYDRAMLASKDVVAVLFADGHVQTMPVPEFQLLIAQPQHKGLNFDLPDVRHAQRP